jgi:hypothetical protein
MPSRKVTGRLKTRLKVFQDFFEVSHQALSVRLFHVTEKPP